MGIIGDYASAVSNRNKEVHLKRRKRRQKRKQQEAKKRGDTNEVKRLAAKKDKTNKARLKANKAFTSASIKTGVGLAKAAAHAYAGDPAGVAVEFI